MIKEILEYNKKFVESKEYKQYQTSKYPDKKLAIVTCMDTRLVELLPAALGLKNGDAKIIKNAGGVIAHPFGSAMRSLIIGIYELDIEEIIVIGHTDCGAKYTCSEDIKDKMMNNGITQKDIDLVNYFGIDFDNWISGFYNLDQSVRESIRVIKKHPLVPEHINVYGLVVNSETGELREVV